MPGSSDFGLRDAGLPPKAVYDPLQADVGSAKKPREHPPVAYRVKNCLTRPCGLYLKDRRYVIGISSVFFSYSLIYKCFKKERKEYGTGSSWADGR